MQSINEMKDLKRSIVVLILSLLLIGSTFLGVSLNGGDKGWIYVNGPFRDFLNGITVKLSPTWQVIRVMLIGWSLVLLLMPILVLTKLQRLGLRYVPPIYLLLTIAYFPLSTPLCIPFSIVWIVAIYYLNSQRKQIIH